MRTRRWRGWRFDPVGYLLFGSILLVWWRWSSLSWHAKGMILAAYGVVLLLIMLLPALRTRRLLKTGAQAGGTVIGAEQGTSIQGGRTGPVTYYYHPTVRFTTLGGRQVVFTSGLGTPSEPEMGYRLRVRYRPKHPEQAELDRTSTWMVRAVFGVLGGLGLLVAGVFVYGLEPGDVSIGIDSKLDGTGQVHAVPASGRIGEMLTVYDEFGDAQLMVTVAQLKFSAGDQVDQPVHGLYMGAYVRLSAVGDEPDVVLVDINALVGGRRYGADATTASRAFDPSWTLCCWSRASGRPAGWCSTSPPGTASWCCATWTSTRLGSGRSEGSLGRV